MKETSGNAAVVTRKTITPDGTEFFSPLPTLATFDVPETLKRPQNVLADGDAADRDFRLLLTP